MHSMCVYTHTLTHSRAFRWILLLHLSHPLSPSLPPSLPPSRLCVSVYATWNNEIKIHEHARTCVIALQYANSHQKVHAARTPSQMRPDAAQKDRAASAIFSYSFRLRTCPCASTYHPPPTPSRGSSSPKGAVCMCGVHMQVLRRTRQTPLRHTHPLTRSF